MGQAEFVFKFTLIILIAQACAVNIKLRNLECKVLDKHIGEFTKCFIKAVKRDVSEGNVYLRLAMKPLDNVTVNVRFARRGANEHNVLYQYTIDACAFFRNTRRNPLAELFYSFLGAQKYSNVNHTCPYNHDLIIDRCQLNTQLLNVLAIAKGDYKIFSTAFFFGIKALEIDLSLSVI